jgi:hypothetical protein
MLDIRGVLAVKSLSLTINRLARWSPHIGTPLSRRDALASRRRADLRTGAKPDHSDSAQRSHGAGKADSVSRRALSVTRDIFHARLACPSQTTRGTRQSTFQNHSISTTQLDDGMWVAAFGRLDGEMMAIENGKRAVLETCPHEAETIAIADAQIQIEEQGAA